MAWERGRPRPLNIIKEAGVDARAPRWIAPLAALFAFVLTASAAEKIGLEALRAVPNLSIYHYPISGGNPQELRQAMDRSGPTDDFGQRRDAYTYWHLSWHFAKGNVADVQVSTRIKVTLPEWREEQSAPAAQRKQWRAFMEAVIRHELNHVRHVTENAPRIRAAIADAAAADPSLTKAEANKIASGILREIRRLDRDYDQTSGSGRREGVVFP